MYLSYYVIEPKCTEIDLKKFQICPIYGQSGPLWRQPCHPVSLLLFHHPVSPWLGVDLTMSKFKRSPLKHLSISCLIVGCHLYSTSYWQGHNSVTKALLAAVEFLTKSDTHALNAHVVVCQILWKIYKYVFHMVFLITCYNVMKNVRYKSDN